MAVEDFPVLQGTVKIQKVQPKIQSVANSASKLILQDVGLCDISSCKVTEASKEKLVQLLVKYNNVFSKHPLDCGVKLRTFNTVFVSHMRGHSDSLITGYPGSLSETVPSIN